MMIRIRSPKKTGDGFECENSGLKVYRDAQCTQANMKRVIIFVIKAERAFKTFEPCIFYLDELDIFILGKASKKNRFFLGKSPKLWVGGGQES